MTTRKAIPEGRYLTLESGLKLHYHEAGHPSADRPSLLFLHGSGPGASGYSNFQGNFPAFVDAGYHCLIPDYIGFGLSDKPADIAYSVPFHAAVMHDFLAHKGVRRFVPVGNSLGGYIALVYALKWPQQVAKLIVMAPGGIEDRATYAAHMPGPQAMGKWIRERPQDEASFRELMSNLVFDKADITDQAVAERFAIALSQPSQVWNLQWDPSYDPLEPRLQEIGCPVLALWGFHDRFLPVRHALTLAARVPHARVVISNRAGHWYMIEEREDFNRQCLAFLNA